MTADFRRQAVIVKTKRALPIKKILNFIMNQRAKKPMKLSEVHQKLLDKSLDENPLPECEVQVNFSVFTFDWLAWFPNEGDWLRNVLLIEMTAVKAIATCLSYGFFLPPHTPNPTAVLSEPGSESNVLS